MQCPLGFATSLRQGVEVAKASAAAKARLGLATRWSMMIIFCIKSPCPLGLATTTVVIYYIKVKFRGR